MSNNLNIAVCMNFMFECITTGAHGEKGKLLPRGARCALEAALVLKETLPSTSISAIVTGPPASGWALHHSLALGVDQAVHLICESSAEADVVNPVKASLSLSQYLKDKSFNLIMCGFADAKYDNVPLGPLLAEQLKLPFLSEVVNINNINQEAGRLEVTRFLSRGNRLKLQTTLPAIIGVHTFYREPRYLPLRSLKRTGTQQVIKIPLIPWQKETNCDSSEYLFSPKHIIIKPLRIRPKTVPLPPPNASYRERLDFIVTGGGYKEKCVKVLEGDAHKIAAELIAYLINENLYNSCK